MNRLILAICLLAFASLACGLSNNKEGTASDVSIPTKKRTGDYNKLTYQSTYDDVLNEFGEPDKEVSSFPPDAQIPNTMMYYAKQGQVVWVVWEFPPKGKPYDRTQTHYMGTKGLYPEKVLHVSQSRFKVMMDAYKFIK